MTDTIKELVTGLMGILIIGATLYGSIVQGHQSPVLLTLSGAVISFYFTRQAVTTGANGVANAATESAGKTVRAVQDAYDRVSIPSPGILTHTQGTSAGSGTPPIVHP